MLSEHSSTNYKMNMAMSMIWILYNFVSGNIGITIIGNDFKKAHKIEKTTSSSYTDWNITLIMEG